MPLKQHIITLADGQAYRHALFYTLPGGLRFAMAEGGNYFTRVLTAVRKACIVCDDVFAGASKVLVHLQCHATPNRFELRQTLRQLALAGIAIPRRRQCWADPGPRKDPGDDSWWVNLVLELPASSVPSLLWCAFASEMTALRPNPHCLVYLINPASGLIVHPYDDRGMDVVGAGHAALRQLYERHHGWLLDHDLDTMRRSFAGPP